LAQQVGGAVDTATPFAAKHDLTPGATFVSGRSTGEFSPGYYFYNSPPFSSQTRSILGSAYLGVMNYHTARSAGMLSPTLDVPHFGNLCL